MRKRKRLTKLSDEQKAETRKRRARRNLTRNYYSQHPIDPSLPVAAAISWLLPWDWWKYPGRTRGLWQLVRAPYSKSTLIGWSKKNNAPIHIMRLLLKWIEARLELGHKVATALAAAIAEKEARQCQPPGFMKIDPVTGLNTQYSRGYRPVANDAGENRGELAGAGHRSDVGSSNISDHKAGGALKAALAVSELGDLPAGAERRPDREI
jgi:hypothetical protein